MILGHKTRLRAIEREDLLTFVRWFNDPEVRRYLEMYLPMSKAEEEAWFEAYLKDDTSRNFAIETEEGELIGTIGLDDLDWKNRSACLGIVIAEKEYWGGLRNRRCNRLGRFCLQRDEPSSHLSLGLRVQRSGHPLLREVRISPRGARSRSALPGWEVPRSSVDGCFAPGVRRRGPIHKVDT